MKMRLTLLSLFMTAGLAAQDGLENIRVQNAGGTMIQLREVRVMRVEPDGLRVLHSAGSAKVPYELLPEALQAKYGFTAVKAQEHREGLTAAATIAAQNLAAAQQAESTSAAPTMSSGPRTSRFASPHFSGLSSSFNTPTVATVRSYSSSSRGRYSTSPSCVSFGSSYYASSCWYPTSCYTSCGSYYRPPVSSSSSSSSSTSSSSGSGTAYRISSSSNRVLSSSVTASRN